MTLILSQMREENIPHSPKEEASCFLASKEEISPAEDNHNTIVRDDCQSGSEWPTSWITYDKSSGRAGCGLFAIAFASALLNGLHPGAYSFDQSLMRSHLLNCFERGEMELFPIIKERRVKKIKRIEEIIVYCSCRRPLTRGAQFIQCGACRESHQFLCKV